MSQKDEWWPLQFVEITKEIARLYDIFDETRELEPFDQARELWQDLNKRYCLKLDLLDFVKIGRSLLGKQTLPQI
jgi:hypothetical protein